MPDKAIELHRRSIVIDGLGDNPGPAAFRQGKEGGVTAFHATIASVFKAEHISEVMLDYSKALDMFEMFPRDILLVETVADLERAKREEKVGVIFGYQGLTQIGHGLHWLQILHKIGLRVCGLTYNESNYVGCSCSEFTDTGLTYFGGQAVREMNRIGIVVDLSHVGERTSFDAIKVSSKPVTLSHSNPRRLIDHPRNVSDDLMKAVAETGGVVGITQYAPLLDNGKDLPTVETVVDHIDYAVNLVGIDHVGIGTDSFSGSYSWSWWLSYMTRFQDLVPSRYLEPALEGLNTHNVQGYASNADFGKFTAAMLARGYSEEAVQKVLGLNLLRLYGACWK